MKQRQFITAFSLTVVLSGLSPVVAADAGRTPGRRAISNSSNTRPFESTRPITLSREQTGPGSKGGRILYQVCSNDVCSGYDTESRVLPPTGLIPA